MVHTRYFCRFEDKNIIYFYVKLEEFEDTNHNTYIEEEQTTQWLKRQNNRQHNDLKDRRTDNTMT
jgi:hypothetical protein